jgi:hypothetical protein
MLLLTLRLPPRLLPLLLLLLLPPFVPSPRATMSAAISWFL